LNKDISETNSVINNQEVLGRTNHLLFRYDMDSIENDASNNSSIVACIRCSGNVFTEPLPSNEMRDTHTDTQTDGRVL
jgi:hypothetical protein